MALPGTSFSMTANSYQGLSLILPSSAQGTITLSMQGTSGTLQHSATISIQIQQQGRRVELVGVHNRGGPAVSCQPSAISSQQSAFSHQKIKGQMLL